MGLAYDDAATFLQLKDYKNVLRWISDVFARPAVQRGIKVNRTSGPPEMQLRERHDASDFELRTQDKLEPESETAE
jgi:GST-like protein